MFLILYVSHLMLSYFPLFEIAEDSLTENDKQLLEETVMDVYNSISFASCNQHFKRIKKVKLLIDQVNQRDLQEQLSMPQLQLPSSLEIFQDLMDFNGTLNVTSGHPANWTMPPSAAPSYAPHLPKSSIFKLEGQCRNCLIDGSKFLLVSKVAFDLACYLIQQLVTEQ